MNKKIYWIKIPPRSLEDREDLATLLSSDTFGSILFSETRGELYRTHNGFWYRASVQ